MCTRHARVQPNRVEVCKQLGDRYSLMDRLQVFRQQVRVSPRRLQTLRKCAGMRGFSAAAQLLGDIPYRAFDLKTVELRLTGPTIYCVDLQNPRP